jgi:hypothetical protein
MGSGILQSAGLLLVASHTTISKAKIEIGDRAICIKLKSIAALPDSSIPLPLAVITNALLNRVNRGTGYVIPEFIFAKGSKSVLAAIRELRSLSPYCSIPLFANYYQHQQKVAAFTLKTRLP